MSLLHNLETVEGSEETEESNMQASASSSSAEDTNIQDKCESSKIKIKEESLKSEESSEDEEIGRLHYSASSSSAEDTNMQDKCESSKIKIKEESLKIEESSEDEEIGRLQASASSSSTADSKIQKKRRYEEVQSEAGSQQIRKVAKVEPLKPDAHKPVNMCATLDEKISVTQDSTEPTTKITLTVMAHREIMIQLKKLEANLVKPIYGYIMKQPDLIISMRNKQVTWLMNIFMDMNVKLLHTAVYYLDCFLSHRPVLRQEMRVLTAAAGLMACQFEKECFQTNNYWIQVAGNTFTESELLQKKEMIQIILNNRLERPTIISFIQHIYSVDTTNNLQEIDLMNYICELTLVEGDQYVKYAPSLVASAAVALARYTLYCNKVWPRELVAMTGYEPMELCDPFILLHRALQNACTSRRYTVVKSKYMDLTFGRIALIKTRGYFPYILA